MKRLLLLLFAFAFMLTDVSAELKTVVFTSKDLNLIGFAVMSKGGITIKIPYSNYITSAEQSVYWPVGDNQFPMSYWFTKNDVEMLPITITGSNLREVRWYYYSGTGISGLTVFSGASQGTIGSDANATNLFNQLKAEGLGVSDPYAWSSAGHAFWKGNYSGNLTLYASGNQARMWVVEVDYESIPPTPSGYVDVLNYDAGEWKYSALDPSSLSKTFKYNQFSMSALSQNGYDMSTDQYNINAISISNSKTTSTADLVESETNTGGTSLTVNLQDDTPLYGDVKFTIRGYYKNNTSKYVNIHVTYHCIPELATPTITVADQQKKYTGKAIPFEIKPKSTNSTAAFSYFYGNGLTKTGTNTCTALEEGTYTVNITQPAGGWYNPGFATATLTVLPEDLGDFWSVPSGFNKSSGYTENFITVCPLTFGDDTYGYTAGTNDDLDYTSGKRVFKYFTKGTKPANGNATTLPTTGTYYKFESSKDDYLLTVGIKLSKRCKFWLLDYDTSAGTVTSLTKYGSGLETWRGANGTVSLFTKAGHEYYFFSTDEPLAIYGYRYNDNTVMKYRELNGFLITDRDYTKQQ